MAKGSDTRDEILRTAMRLIQTKGFNGFSYAHIAEALGVKPAAIHYHFKSKEELGIAIGERFRDRWHAFRARSADQGPQARLEATFEMYARLADRGLNCPMAAVHAELDAIPPGVARIAREVIDELVDWLEDALEDGRDQGALHFEGPPRELALVFLSMAHGALLLGRVRGAEVYHATRRRLFREVLCTPPAPTAVPEAGPPPDAAAPRDPRD